MLQSMRLLRVASEQQQQSTKRRRKSQQKANKMQKFPADFPESIFLLLQSDHHKGVRILQEFKTEQLVKSLITFGLKSLIHNMPYSHHRLCRLPFTSLKALCSSLSQDICTCCSFCLKHFDTETIDLRLGLERMCGWDSNSVWDSLHMARIQTWPKPCLGLGTHKALSPNSAKTSVWDSSPEPFNQNHHLGVWTYQFRLCLSAGGIQQKTK